MLYSKTKDYRNKQLIYIIKFTRTANIAYIQEHLETSKAHTRKRSRKSKACRSISNPEYIYQKYFEL